MSENQVEKWGFLRHGWSDENKKGKTGYMNFKLIKFKNWKKYKVKNLDKMKCR